MALSITGPAGYAAPFLVAANYAGVSVMYSDSAEPVTLTTSSGTVNGRGAVLRCAARARTRALAPVAFRDSQSLEGTLAG